MLYFFSTNAGFVPADDNYVTVNIVNVQILDGANENIRSLKNGYTI